MAKDDRSPLNPFTGKEHYDTLNDDEFLQMCYEAYYSEINASQLLDQTPDGQLVMSVASKLIRTVEDFLIKIGRYDYVEDYYDWEFLAFILGHEMAHALLDHTRTKFSVQQTKNTLTTASLFGSLALDLMGFGNAGAIARTAVNLADVGSHFLLTQPWGRDQEYEADKLGMIMIHLAGYDVAVVPEFWEVFSNNSANTFDFFSNFLYLLPSPFINDRFYFNLCEEICLIIVGSE